MTKHHSHKHKKEKFWLEDPSDLFKNFCEFNPVSMFSEKSKQKLLNSLTRFTIILTIVLFCVNKNLNYIFIGLFIIVIIIIMNYLVNTNDENFGNYFDFSKTTNGQLNYAMLPERKSQYFDTKKQENNPLKNVSITDYDKKQEFLKATKSDIDMNKFIKDKMFQTPEQYIFNTDARQFYTMPNSSVPNDQTAFANWLYGTENTCKEGSIYMHQQGTPEQTLSCNGFNVSTPTNFGNLN